VVSTPLKNISQNGNLPQIGVKIKNIGNHHPDVCVVPICLDFLTENHSQSQKLLILAVLATWHRCSSRDSYNGLYTHVVVVVAVVTFPKLIVYCQLSILLLL